MGVPGTRRCCRGCQPVSAARCSGDNQAPPDHNDGVSDPPLSLEVEELDPDVRRRSDLEPTVTEEQFEFDPRSFRFPKQAERRFRVGIVLAALGGLFLFFQVFATVLFASLGWSTASLIGLGMFLLCIVGWTLLIGARTFWMGEHSPVEWAWNLTMKREAPVPVVNEAPAQLLRKRGDPRGAVALYERWIKEHPSHAILVFRLAEIHHHDLKNRGTAGRLYGQFASQVRAREHRPTEEDRTNLGIADGLAEELLQV